MSELIIALAQVNTAVGDLEGNARKILEFTERAADARADIVIFPELCLNGYPPEDLLLKTEFVASSMAAACELAKKVGDIIAVVGFVESDYDTFNSAAVMNNGEIRCTYRKTFLPNYGVFDEKRYFGTGSGSVVLDVGGVRVGITICEDIWFAGGPVEEQVARGGAEILLNLSASPFNRGKYDFRKKLIETQIDGRPRSAGLRQHGRSAGRARVRWWILRLSSASSVSLRLLPRFREELLLCGVGLGSLKGSRMLEPRFRYSSAEYPQRIDIVRSWRGRRLNAGGSPRHSYGDAASRPGSSPRRYWRPS